MISPSTLAGRAARGHDAGMARAGRGAHRAGRERGSLPAPDGRAVQRERGADMLKALLWIVVVIFVIGLLVVMGILDFLF